MMSVRVHNGIILISLQTKRNPSPFPISTTFRSVRTFPPSRPPFCTRLLIIKLPPAGIGEEEEGYISLCVGSHFRCCPFSRAPRFSPLEACWTGNRIQWRLLNNNTLRQQGHKLWLKPQFNQSTYWIMQVRRCREERRKMTMFVEYVHSSPLFFLNIVYVLVHITTVEYGLLHQIC